jgi:hypothetical protein
MGWVTHRMVAVQDGEGREDQLPCRPQFDPHEPTGWDPGTGTRGQVRPGTRGTRGQFIQPDILDRFTN